MLLLLRSDVFNQKSRCTTLDYRVSDVIVCALVLCTGKKMFIWDNSRLTTSTKCDCKQRHWTCGKIDERSNVIRARQK